MNHTSGETTRRFHSQLAASQLVAFALYGIFFHDMIPSESGKNSFYNQQMEHNLLNYPFFQATHLMVVLGFALLLNFINRHRLTTMVTCLWVGCLSAQFYLIWNAIWTGIMTDKPIELSMQKIAGGEFAAASVLIAVCGIIGKASNYQYFLMTMIFMPVYAFNEVFVLDVIDAHDVGGSMVIHAFGAAFGLGVAYHLNYPNASPSNRNLHPNQTSFASALLGTILLWALWPGFNGAAAETASAANLAVINTYLSLLASVIGTFLASTYFYQGKFNLDQLANATLAGGVIMGSGADMIHNAFVSNFMGLLGGLGSTVLFQFAPKILLEKGLHDVAGIFNLHLAPGVVGAIMSIIFRAVWGNHGAERQLFGLIVTLILSCGTGYYTGIFIRPFTTAETPNDYYNDYFFISLEGEMEDKLKYYVKSEKHDERELFEQYRESGSVLSEKLLPVPSAMKGSWKK